MLQPPIICFDCEFTESEEMLELSVYDFNEDEVYHHYFKPEVSKSWREDIHHITPTMVKDEKTFSQRKKEVQLFIDSAEYITGFAVENDLKVLAQGNIKGLDEKKVLDVREMYWYLFGKDNGMSPHSIPSLLACAGALGIEFREEMAHSASADTKATILAFKKLLEIFSRREGGGINNYRELLDLFISKIENAKSDFNEMMARGFIKVVRKGDSFKMKFGHLKDQSNNEVVLEIEVADRFKAEYELRKKFKKKEILNRPGSYKLNNKDLESIGRYTNIYNEDESQWCKKIIKNLGRLSI